ncbi:MAG: type II secretion system F family protein [bacterium]|nr:type II secretion system F family protein [bacterium]
MLYTYSAIDKAGVTHVGEMEAEAEHTLAERLKRENLILLESKEKIFIAGNLLDFKSIFSRIIPITLVERMMFARNLAVMIGAGLPLAKALKALEEQIENKKFKKIIVDLGESIVQGKSFSESLARHEKVFGPLFVSMVASGEVSGKLEYTLKLLARQMKRDHDLVSKVRGALIYPAIILSALVLIGALMMIYVVPTLTQTFRELEIPLPLTTQLIIGTSEFLSHYYLLAFGATIVLVFFVLRFIKTPVGRQWWGTIALKLPIFGPLIKKLNSARFARILSSLLSAGISINNALEITSRVLGNVHYQESLMYASAEIQKGRNLGDALRNYSSLYPPLVIQMIEVGEETGTVSRMLLRLALFYESEVSNTTKNLSSIIEPVLMIFIGAIVGFFAISMIQPIYSGVGGL